MKPLFSRRSIHPIFSRWSLLVVCLAVVAVLLVIWEVVEHAFFADVNPKIMHQLHLVRDVLGASVTTMVAVRVVLSNWEKAQGEIIKRDKFLASIVDNSQDAIVVIDSRGEILAWNHAAERIFGYTQAEALGRSFRILNPKEPEYSDNLAELLQKMREKGVVRGHEAEMITKRGKRFLTELTATQILDQEGKVAGVSILIQDITQKKILQDRLEQSDRVATLGQVAASIAHEIGTPLNVISGNAEYLMSDKDLRRSPGKELKIIVEETERISKLIKRLMHITQPQTLDMKPVQLNNIVKRVLDFTAHEMESAQVALESSLEKDLPEVLGDADQLEQVFLNLVMNAIEAMPQGGRLFVSTSPWYLETEKSQVVQVRVSDTGTGIPKEVMSKIFDPFFTTKKAKGYTGLGLSVTSRIIEDHKGTIKIDSVMDKGTTITVRLPSIG